MATEAPAQDTGPDLTDPHAVAEEAGCTLSEPVAGVFFIRAKVDGATRLPTTVLCLPSPLAEESESEGMSLRFALLCGISLLIYALGMGYIFATYG